MGLDITAYSRIALVDEDVDDEHKGQGRLICLYPNPEFPRQAENIKRGCYKYEEEFGFRAGSYGGYNAWRRDLARLVGTTPEKEWGAPEEARQEPFSELINFSDCDGVIGPTVCAKLARDFAQWQERADARPDEWFRDLYDHWRRAFEIGADGGAVTFH